MGERYMFFDSIDGEDERYYTADEFAEYFRQFLTSGVYAVNDQAGLTVKTDGTGMITYITPGKAFIEGYLYKIEGENLALKHRIAHPTLNRIDRIVIRLDKTLECRYVRAFILEGEPSENPIIPPLRRDENIYEISLAKVVIIAGKSFIEQREIIDERTDETVCGFVSSLISIPTSQFQEDWDNWKAVILPAWEEWVATTQPQLVEQFNQWFEGVIEDTDVDIDAFTQAFNAWFSGVKQQYDNWFDGIEGGTFITYEKLGRGLETQDDGIINISTAQHEADLIPHFRFNYESELVYDDGNLIEIKEKIKGVLQKREILSYDQNGILREITVEQYAQDGQSIIYRHKDTLIYDQDRKLEKVERTVIER